MVVAENRFFMPACISNIMLLEHNQCHLKTEVELDQLYTSHPSWIIQCKYAYIDFEWVVCPADGRESFPQFEVSYYQECEFPHYRG